MKSNKKSKLLNTVCLSLGILGVSVGLVNVASASTFTSSIKYVCDYSETTQQTKDYVVHPTPYKVIYTIDRSVWPDVYGSNKYAVVTRYDMITGTSVAVSSTYQKKGKILVGRAPREITYTSQDNTQVLTLKRIGKNSYNSYYTDSGFNPAKTFAGRCVKEVN